jgi:hypothetical protein
VQALTLQVLPLTLFVLLSVASLSAQVDPPTGPSNTAGSEDRCTVRIVDADTLKIGDDPFYVDPLFAESDSGGRILLLGRVIHRYDLNPARPSKVSTRSLLGAVVLPNGRASVVNAPVAGPRFDGIRALALPGGRWGIVFAQLRSAVDVPVDTASALWYGEYDGHRWSGVERLPMPDPVINLHMASNLIQSEGGLTWVVKTSTQRLSIAILRRTAGGWTSDRVYTQATYIQPTLSRGGRVDLAVVQGDTTLQTDWNSLILRAAPSWSVVRVLQAGAQEPVYSLDRQRIDGMEILSWTTPRSREEWTVRTRIGFADDVQGTTITLDTSAIIRFNRPAPFMVDGAGPTWILPHHLPSGSRELGFIAVDSTGKPRTLGRIENPFLIPPIAARVPGGVILSGPIAPGRRYVASLLVRVAARCENVRTPAP